MTAYRVGFVGTGRIASTLEDEFTIHPVSIAGAFVALPDVQIVAACSRAWEGLRRFGERWHVGALYQDYRQMLQAEPLDIVVVATPPEYHPEIVIAAAESGAKGIFCEKPMALSLGECDAMLEACERRGVKLLVDFTNRWTTQYAAIQQLITSGEMGSLLHLVGYSQGCKPHPEWEAKTQGPLLHDAIHVIDAMRLFGGDVEAVLGTSTRRKHKHLNVEDTSYALLRFTNGGDGMLLSDELTEYCRIELELHFERGVVRTDGGLGGGLWRSQPSPVEQGWWAELRPSEFSIPATDDTSMLAAARDLVQCIGSERAPRAHRRAGRADVEIIMAIYESQRQGNQWVKLPLPRAERMIDVLRQEALL